MYIYTFERNICSNRLTVVQNFDIPAANMEEAEHKAIQQIDDNLPLWVMDAENVIILGQLLKVVRSNATSNRKETA